MAKITDPDSLVVDTNITIDTDARTFAFTVAGALVAADGVSLQALYSKFVDLWTTSDYNKFPFPMYAIDSRSGQYQFGFDGHSYNGWKPANDTSRGYLRDGGWSEYNSSGTLNRVYTGVVTLGTVSSGAQLYYQRSSSGSPTNFLYTGAVNEPIQVYGDASNGDFDTRTYLRVFCRIEGYTHDDSTLTEIGETATGAYKLQFPITNETDSKIEDDDAAVAADAPYTSIDITYYGVNQNRTIAGVAYPFRIIIDGADATAEQIYTKIQYQLRQSSDIDEGAGTVTGKTANELLYWVGDTLYTTQGVYIDNYDPADANRIIFTDQNGVERQNSYTASGTITFSDNLVGAGGVYVMYFSTLPGDDNDYGEVDAVIVEDASAVAISGSIDSSPISFSFDYTNNDQGGRSPDTDATVTVFAVRPGHAKPIIATGTITRSTNNVISAVAELDRVYTT